MNPPVELHPAVRDEVDEAYTWYERKSPQIQRAMDLLSETFGKAS